MTEFALVLPILALLLFGIVQFGLVFNNYLTLTDAVRSGARKAAVSIIVPIRRSKQHSRSQCRDGSQAVGLAGHRHSEPQLGARRRGNRLG